MKLILTEEQLNLLLQTEGVARLLQESLGDSKNLENLKRIIRKLLATGVALTTIVAALNKQNLPQSEIDMLINAAMAEQDATELVDTTFQTKVEACREYMETALKNQNYSWESTDLKPETLVKASMEENFDLPFLMAVAHQESCFGATPRAQRTNSVFSEGSWDNGKNTVTYSDPNESVYGYIDLMNRSYIVNGKSLFDLLVPGEFVNGIGKRYASDVNYERKIKSLRNRILQKYPELV
jgi:DNA-binding transcriptional MerR regulator